MKSENHVKRSNPGTALKRLREKVLGGAHILLETLTEEELSAMQNLLFNDEVEIVNSACKPFLIAKLDKIMLPP